MVEKLVNVKIFDEMAAFKKKKFAFREKNYTSEWTKKCKLL